MLKHLQTTTTTTRTMRLLLRILPRAPSSRLTHTPLPLAHPPPIPRHNDTLRRSFISTPAPHAPKTIGQLKARNSTGPFSWKSGLLFVVTGGGLVLYFRMEKDRLERKRVTEMSKGVGKPKVGGPITLKDLEGRGFSEEDLKGKYSFVCFT